METNSLANAVAIVGSQSALARSIGVSQFSIWYWLRRRAGRPPGEHVIAIERATLGRVTRHDLRPDLYPQEAVA